MPQETCRQFLEIPNFLPWLIKRLRAQGMDYNKVYSSEILGIMLQNSERAREEMVKLEGVDKLLRGIAAYRKRDPADSEEAEYVQNMFDCICSLMLELMIRMMREKVFAATLALKLVDHSLRHCPENCQIFVEKLGLKVLFAIFMKKGLEKPTAWRRNSVLGVVLSLLALSLEGCDEPQTCYPDSSATDTGEYTCVSNRYCSRQDYATQLPAAMSLQACMDECKSRNCKVIQYDCGTHCWLLDNCGSETESGCQSSVYYRDLNWVDTAATTTTSTTTVLGQCFPFTVDSGEYACTATRYCRNQDSGTNTGDGTLNDCLAQCSNDAACVAVQYDCSVSCVLFTDGTTCGDEMQTTCGSSIYYKHALKLGTMPLQDCFSECDTRTGCTGIQYDCNVDCWLLVDVSCGTEFDTSCGSSAGTTISGVGGECYPSSTSNGKYTCQAQVYCSNQHDALKLGAMTLQACKAACEEYSNCDAIQYNCNTDCWLLRSCDSYVATTCGSSVYLRSPLGWPVTTTTTTIFGACFPTTEGLYSFNDFTCTPAVYCSNQAEATVYGEAGQITINQCTLGRDLTAGVVMRHTLSRPEACWLLSSCQSEVTSQCGSSVYRLSGTKAPGQTYALPDGHTWIAYSSSSCTTDDCLVSATCPSNTWPIECLTIPPNTGDGAYQGTYADGLVATGDGRTCEAKGDGAQITLAQAVASRGGALRGVVLFTENTGAFQEGDLSISCAVGSALSCNCLTAWQVTSVCQGTFEPTYSDTSPPKCEINIPVDSVAHRRRAAGAVGATLAATCGKGRYDKAYLWASNQFTNTDTSVEYCGWSSVPYDKITGYGEVDCSGWMTDCVKKCSWCGACEAVLYNPDSYVGRPGVRCRMEGSASASLSIVERPPSFEPTMEAVLYVNTRHSNCPKSFNIQRMSFFSDTGAVRRGPPGRPPASSTDQALEKSTEAGVIDGSGENPAPIFGVQAMVAPSTSLPNWCAEAGTSFGNSVAFRHVPSSLNLAEESEVTMTGTMHVDCSETITPVVNGCSGFWWKGQLAAALASLLGLPKHMVELQETFLLPLATVLRASGLQVDQSALDDPRVVWILTYTVTIKIYVDRPHVAAVPNSVQAQLEEMRQSLPLLSSTLMSQIALDPGVTADVGIFSSFSRVDVPPSHLELPPPTTTTTGAPTTVPQTTQAGTGVQTTPTPEDETGVILGLIFGTIGGVVVISYFLYAVMRRRSARARPGAVTPATGATGGAPVSSAGPTAVTIGEKCEVPDPPFFTREWMNKHSSDGVLCDLDDELNEVYLWHGTQVRVGLQIAQEDFNLTFAGSGAGTMYGKGLYFTESATKEWGRAVNTYREIVVYDADQVYPEYLVIYERVHGGVATTPREDLPFLLELPLNPYTEGFREHWVVKHKIKDLIQRLAEGTCRNPVKVNKVRRVEDSSLWCRYINWKRCVARLEESDAKIKSPNELDGNPESGHVLTEKILKENHGDEAIRSLGMENRAYYFRDSPQAADRQEFHERLWKIQPDRKDGIYYVLLCRATCGHIYYTEKDWDSGADGPAKSRGCSCVLANPNQRGPREYILFDVGQEYHRSVLEADRLRDQGLATTIDRELEEQLFLDRCDAGLFTLQQVDLILVRLVNMGNRQASEEIGKLMDVKGVKLEEIRNIVVEYCSNLGQKAQEERREVISYMRAMLTRQALHAFKGQSLHAGSLSGSMTQSLSMTAVRPSIRASVTSGAGHPQPLRASTISSTTANAPSQRRNAMQWITSRISQGLFWILTLGHCSVYMFGPGSFEEFSNFVLFVWATGAPLAAMTVLEVCIRVASVKGGRR
eukprot:g25542.t2